MRPLVALVLLLAPFLAGKFVLFLHSLNECRLSNTITFLPTAAQRCTDGSVRLVDGPVESAGRVEVCIHGVWGRFCGYYRYGFYGNYSRVVCRQLGYNVDAGEGELIMH